MKYIQAIFTIYPDNQTTRDLVTAIAGDCGFESFTDESNLLIGYCQKEYYDEERLKKALSTFPLEETNISIDVKDVEDKDWNEVWENNGFEPIVIKNKCIISCFNTTNPPQKGQVKGNFPINIYIDAKQAFGTGNHETTQMIVEKLIDLNLKDKRVLDCGCGTGILGIISAKCGATEVFGYDIDEWSVKNAIHNAEINDVKINVHKGDKKILSKIDGFFDLVLANINRNILIEDLSAFSNILKCGGKVILSGFYEDDANLLKEKANSLRLVETERSVKDNWCCLIFQKNL